MTSGARSELRGLVGATFAYVLPLLLGRGLSVLILPLYTAAMSPEDYGVVGMAATVTPLVATVLGFGLQSTIMRLHFKFEKSEERRSFYGTVVVFQLVGPLLISLALELAGRGGGLDGMFVSLPFHPHLELVLWQSYLLCFPNIGLAMLVVRERARAATLLSIVNSVIQVGLTVGFVIVLRRGAVGQLEANVIAGASQAAISLGVASRFIAFRFSWPMLRRALAFGVPLVPHLLGNWALLASDRWILERFVSATELGLYSLGYTVGSLAGMINGAVAKAIFPVVNRKLTEGGVEAAAVPRLGTMSLVAIAVPGLGLALVAEEALQLLTPPSYHGAAAVVPWVVVGFAFVNVYKLASQGTFFALKTVWVPILTVIAALVNVGLNLFFIPRFGYLAAAVTTAVSYALLALLHGTMAQRVLKVGWPYLRWGGLLVIVVVLYLLGLAATSLGVWLALVLKLAIVTILFPCVLVITGFISRADLAMLRSRLSRRNRARAARGSSV